jgi:hypothetical protein
MKSLIITAIFAVLGFQTAHAADTEISCKYQGQDGGSAAFQFDEDLSGAGVASVVLTDGSKMDIPVSATFTLGDKDGYVAIVVTWGTIFDTMTAALPAKGGNVATAPAYSITSFNADGPKATLKGSLTCTYSENLVHTLKSK